MHRYVLIEIGSQTSTLLAVVLSIKKRGKKQLFIETQSLYQKQLYNI